jgi:uncharacterized protein
MTTNGYLLTPDIAGRLLEWGINTFQITLDGPQESHDRSRPARDGSGTFSKIFANLIALQSRAEEYLVDIRINFDKRNSPRINDFLEMIGERFSGDQRFKIRFRAVGQWGGSNDAQLEVCGLGEATSLQGEMKAKAKKMGLNLSDDIRNIQGLGSQVCYAARPYNFIVGAHGDLMKCTIDLDKKDRNLVGRITPDGELILDIDRFALWTEPAFESDKKCKKCVVLPTCQGAFCPQIRFDTGHSPCSPLRLSAKSELRELSGKFSAGSRSRKVGGGPV